MMFKVMYYSSTKEGKILAKFLSQRYKPLFSKLRRECKHQIMINHGDCYVVAAFLKNHTADIESVANHTLPLNLDFEIKLMRESDLPRIEDDGRVYTLPIMLYNPGSYQAKKWAESPAARKAIIKEVLKDLKDENKKGKN